MLSMEALRTEQQGRLANVADFIYTHVFRGGGFAELADIVTKREHSIADAALQDTVEFELPHGLRLCDPVEHGYYRDPNYQPPEAA